MSPGLNVNDPTVVAAFRAALLHQGLLALAVFAALWLVVLGLRARARGRRGAGPGGSAGPIPAEPAGRLVLLIGFGNLWLFDGFLQAQSKMALGLPSQVIEPVASTSPSWVQHLVNWAGTTWSYHPVQAATAAVWIQVGLGIWMLAATRGFGSRLAGLASVGWGLVVWVFGEAFGGIFAGGSSWLSGAPGAVALYVVAGALIALPERAWRSPRLGRLMLAGFGLFLLGMAVLQAWPGRGSWQGLNHGQLGTVAGMAESMTLTPQPGFLIDLLSSFAGFDAAHGFAVNLLVVVALTVTGLAFLSGRPRLIRPVLIAFAVLCLADWVLIQDLGFLGGLGTDPNTMIPFILLGAAGYLALTRVPVLAVEERAVEERAGAAQSAQAPAEGQAPAWPGRGRRPLATAGSVIAAGGALLIVLGAVPMAVAQASPNADPILAQSIAGTSSADYRAPGFALTDQHGQPLSLASLRGRVVILSFIDPACGTGCPPIAREFRQAAQLLGSAARRVEFVAIVAPAPWQPAAGLLALSGRLGVGRLPNCVLLTGPDAQLRRVWRAYGVSARAPSTGAGAVVLRSAAFVIDRDGYVRHRYGVGTGPGSAATASSFAVLFAGAAARLAA
jgi:cytochrome oxidase Cu insertion factor (SCO1/SenC/PrrC family)